MTRGPRKGAFSTPRQDEHPTTAVASPHERSDVSALSVISARGRGSVSASPFDFDQFSPFPLLIQNQRIIRERIIANKTKASLKKENRNLTAFAKYIEWYISLYGFSPSTAESVDQHFCYEIITYVEKMRFSIAGKSQRVRFMRRFMAAIGVQAALLPMNPYPTENEAAERPTLSPEELRRLLKQAKSEASVVLQRLRELEAMEDGHDPRRASGGRNGDWDRPECRLWIMRNVFRLEIRNFDEWRFERGLAGELRGLEGRPGAITVTANGAIERQVGWKGHLRWFYPWSDDIAPFAVLLLLRTPLNLTAVAAFQAERKWFEAFPFRLGNIAAETHAVIKTSKTRGRRQPLEASKSICATSSMKPWSHPYRVLETVEKLTHPLRSEILRRRDELLRKSARSNLEEQELDKLEAIKNDLFIYKTEQGVTSLAWDSERGTPRSIQALLARAGLTLNLRQLRDSPLLFWYSASGQNLFVVQMLAGHARPETSTLYLRRQLLLDRLADRGKAIFGLSIDLIKTGTFDVAQLRHLLQKQNLDRQQIETLLDAENTTRWGNRCGSPTNPPPEFAYGTEEGGLCRGQDCIDGCPRARWFRDSIVHVAKQLIIAEQAQLHLGLESTDGSSTNDRIDRCQELLSQWPKADVEAAMKEARLAIGDSRDIFLGAGL